MTITPREFVDTWAKSNLREQQGAQSHFNQLCELVGHLTPAQQDPEGKEFTFEEQVGKATGGQGRADVWYKDHFAWEYKGKHKDLDAAYAQLLAYRGGLDNPPLLVVCDFLEYRIYPQWPNTSGQPFVFHNEDLTDPQTLRYITWLLENPDAFLELRKTELERREKITLELAYKFAHLAALMRDYKVQGKAVWEPMQIARFLTKLVFSLFVEDVGLLPKLGGSSVFRVLVDGAETGPEEFVPQLQALFRAMDGQSRTFLMQPVPYFNGGLFAESRPGANDGTEVLDLTQLLGAIEVLGQVSDANWAEVNPTIFGTLFEGALDVSKRAQLGAHYTSEADIRLIIEPVLMQPLYRQWDAIRGEAEPLLQTYLDAETPRAAQQAKDRLIKLHDTMMDALEKTTVLDPACGSGNFLYMSLRALKDLEARVRKTFEPLGLPFRDVVTPRQLYGIEKDEFAAKLASVVVWIGYLQWRYEDEGRVLHPLLKATSRPHPRQLPNPICQDKNSPDEPDRIQCDDSILRYDENGKPYEPEWPAVDVIVSNPPFLGGKRLRSELGDQYVNELFQVYEKRVPHEADLVTYWFEKVRAKIERTTAKRAGLIATNSIRGGANRIVLTRVKETGDIFLAWSDRPWILEGAAVRISIIGFDNGKEQEKILDSVAVVDITADLEGSVDLTKAKSLIENNRLAFMGITPGAPFDVSAETAQKLLVSTNATGVSNVDVVHKYYNAIDVTRRPRNIWSINFGAAKSEQDASKYESPFEYVKEKVLPLRIQSRQTEKEKAKWWLYTRPRPEMWQALNARNRYLATPAVSKHRLFVWLEKHIDPDHALIVIARDDDYCFGVLHSYLHEIWSLRMGTSLEDRPRYTPTTTFETYPFPYSPGKEPTDSEEYRAISEAARQLNEEREAWLNPPDAMQQVYRGSTLQDRTLTNLYNALESHRSGKNGSRNGNSAASFAPRLAALHDTLDAAVLAAYGWSDLVGKLRTPEGDEELLKRLLALNLARAEK